jgi:hypothetical protein
MRSNFLKLALLALVLTLTKSKQSIYTQEFYDNLGNITEVKLNAKSLPLKIYSNEPVYFKIKKSAFKVKHDHYQLKVNYIGYVRFTSSLVEFNRSLERNGLLYGFLQRIQ